jgi:membrane protein YdbS with pleckstrin-like domain
VIQALERVFLSWLRVPPEPAPPSGSQGSLRVFRAGKNYLRLRFVVWAGAQCGAILGLVASLTFVREIEIQVELRRIMELQASSAPGGERVAWDQEAEASRQRNGLHRLMYRVAPEWLREIPRRTPGQLLPWIWIAEIIGLAGFAVQFFWSLFTVRLDYALRWYMVTDRSLRLRWGVLRIQESTMSFANLQQVSVHQGPLQRLLKLADVEVQSAGGGSGNKEHGQDDSMHRCKFHAVDNATEIRDLILSRLRRFRQSGLGDPDDSADLSAAEGDSSLSRSEAEIVAARDLLAELRAWRAAGRG